MLYFLLAVGLSIVFGLLRFVNFAHGAFYLLGAYFCYQAMQWSMSFWTALVVVPIVRGRACVGRRETDSAARLCAAARVSYSRDRRSRARRAGVRDPDLGTARRQRGRARRAERRGDLGQLRLSEVPSLRDRLHGGTGCAFVVGAGRHAARQRGARGQRIDRDGLAARHQRVARFQPGVRARRRDGRVGGRARRADSRRRSVHGYRSAQRRVRRGGGRRHG